MTTEQPSTNPRLVREADLFAEAGLRVLVLCSDSGTWAKESDELLLRSRRWHCLRVGGLVGSPRFRWTHHRYTIARGIADKLAPSRSRLAGLAISRIQPELLAAASRNRARLYVGHAIGALRPAVLSAGLNQAAVGYDIEDVLVGHYASDPRQPARASMIRELEGRYLPRCTYITAASSGIADSYCRRYRLPKKPQVLLNVSSLSQRPDSFRPTHLDSFRPLRLYWFSQTIGPDRGLEDVVCALGLLPDVNVELTLQGTVWGPYADHLHAIARQANVKPSAIKLLDPVPSDNLARTAAEFDIGLALERPDLENRDVTITNKIFLYMLAGMAVLATHTRGQDEIFHDKPGIGAQYPAGNVAALADHIRTLANNRRMLDRAREASWSAATDQYNWERHGTKLLKGVESVLGPSS
jgi:glycosyltransferase involved in cell wall biosynthesis